jgi:hypothetical protein
MTKRFPHDSDEKPLEEWDEADWECAFAIEEHKRDLLTEKFPDRIPDPDEVLEILHPEGVDWEEVEKNRERWSDMMTEVEEAIEKGELESEEEYNLREHGFRALEEIPAYQVAHQLALKAYDALDLPTWEPREVKLLRKITSKATLIASAIAGGHGLGYEPEFITGAIVKSKQALRTTEDVIALIERFAAERQTLKTELEQILTASRAVRTATADWIARLYEKKKNPKLRLL